MTDQDGGGLPGGRMEWVNPVVAEPEQERPERVGRAEPSERRAGTEPGDAEVVAVIPPAGTIDWEPLVARPNIPPLGRVETRLSVREPWLGKDRHLALWRPHRVDAGGNYALLSPTATSWVRIALPAGRLAVAIRLESVFGGPTDDDPPSTAVTWSLHCGALTKSEEAPHGSHVALFVLENQDPAVADLTAATGQAYNWIFFDVEVRPMS